MNAGIPRCAGDSTLAFVTEGYRFGSRRFEKWRTDAFACRLAGHPTIALRGQDAARFFYEEPRLTRVGAIPHSVVHSLQDEGSVQTLDADAHRARKALFLEAFGPDERMDLVERFDRQWSHAEEQWRAKESIVLADEVSAVLTRAAMDWAGIALDAEATARRSREFQAMIDGAGSFGARNWRGRMLRRRTERWAVDVVRRRRAAASGTAAGTPIERIATWQDAAGQTLDAEVAAVELLNVLRPIVAVGRFIVFAALAVRQNPHWRARVLTEPASRMAFAAEVRRTAPFFPAIAARPAEPLVWNGIRFTPRQRVLLDLFATNRHPHEWADAGRFDPARFLFGRGEDARRIVAQGAGDMVEGHRCPGEPATATLLEAAVMKLAAADWSFAEGDPLVDLRRIPASPGVRPVRVHWRG